MRRALVDGALREAEFILGTAAKPAARGDVLLVPLSVPRAVGLPAQALYAAERRWLLNEKRALDGAPERFAERARGVLAGPGVDAVEAVEAVEAAKRLVVKVRTVCG